VIETIKIFSLTPYSNDEPEQSGEVSFKAAIFVNEDFYFQCDASWLENVMQPARICQDIEKWPRASHSGNLRLMNYSRFLGANWSKLVRL